MLSENTDLLCFGSCCLNPYTQLLLYPDLCSSSTCFQPSCAICLLSHRIPCDALNPLSLLQTYIPCVSSVALAHLVLLRKIRAVLNSHLFLKCLGARSARLFAYGKMNMKYFICILFFLTPFLSFGIADIEMKEIEIVSNFCKSTDMLKRLDDYLPNVRLSEDEKTRFAFLALNY